jgi:hypothetical protein
MVIDCTLSNLAVPGFSDFTPEFGVKKEGKQPVTAREANKNVMMPFARQRPFMVPENSSTSVIEAHTPFVIQAAGITLALGEGAFAGCEVKAFNLSGGASTVTWGSGVDKRAEIGPGRGVKLEWSGSAWSAPAEIIREAEDRNAAIEAAEKAGMAVYAEGCGRSLFDVFGITAGTQAQKMAACMAEIRRRCNNNGEIDDTGIPDFTGIMLGDYMDGLDLSAIPAENSGTAGQAWNDTYKNNRIVVSGFNTYKGIGDTENTKNHILFTFRDIPLKKRMNASNANAGGYAASEMRAFLEGTNGNGTGDKSGVTTAAFMNALKAQLAGGGSENYLYTIRKAHSTKSASSWANHTVWLPSEIELFGVPVYGDEGVRMAEITSPSIATRPGGITPVHIPLYQKSYAYRVKRYNGARQWHFLQTPNAATATGFAEVDGWGLAYANSAGGVGGVAPAFCVA